MAPYTLADFDYELPSELIAQEPSARRSASRLLRVDGLRFDDTSFSELPEFLRPGDLLVVNDSRVMNARLIGHKESGGQVEVLIERVDNEGKVLAMVRASKAPRAGSFIRLGDAVDVEVLGRQGEFFHLDFGVDAMDIISRLGRLPLPPYIERLPEAGDEARYQTVYSRSVGSVAAPTAGLHFDDELLARLAEMGVGLARVTLHVGAGTFQPVRTTRLEEHRMHAERYEVPEETVEAIEATRARRGRIVAVGTTTVRVLESAKTDRGEVRPGSGETRLFITPGYNFRVVDCLITNFHLPKSSLLMLVSAFGGYEVLRAAYAHAIAARYRFFSYGDAMLLNRKQG